MWIGRALLVLQIALAVVVCILSAVAAVEKIDHYSLRFGTRNDADAISAIDPEHFLHGLTLRSALKKLNGFKCSRQPADAWPLQRTCFFAPKERKWKYEIQFEGAGEDRLTSVASTLRGPAFAPSEIVEDWATRTSALIATAENRTNAKDVIRRYAGAPSAAFGFATLELEVGPNALWYVVAGRDADQPTVSLVPKRDRVSSAIRFFSGGPGFDFRPDLTQFGQELLASSFAPILRLDTGERFYPLRIESYAAYSRLCEFRLGSLQLAVRNCRRPSSEILDTALPELEEPWFYALDIPEVSPNDGASSYEDAEEKMRKDAGGKYTVYWHFASGRDADHVYLEYWFFYAYNDFKNRHEGDWEMIALEFPWTRHSFLTPDPARIVYSAHTGHSAARPLKQVGFERDEFGLHPIVYVYPGSHANYFERKRHEVVECWPPGLAVSICAHTTEADHDSRSELKPSEYELQTLDDRPFAGRYGPANYVGHGRTPISAGPAVDPRLKEGWRNPATLFAAE